MTLFGSFEDIKDAFRFYSVIIGNTSPEEQRMIYAQLREAIEHIDPEYTFDHEDPLTAYEVFLILEKLEPCGVLDSTVSIEGYYDPALEFTTWDPNNPIDDTDQYPDTDCKIERKSHEVLYKFNKDASEIPDEATEDDGKPIERSHRIPEEI